MAGNTTQHYERTPSPTAKSSESKQIPSPINIAIIGGGIVGIALALGLLKRNLRVRIYEQASNSREIGAGVAFTATAQRCMRHLDPAILEAIKRVGNENLDVYNRYVDGYHSDNSGVDPNHKGTYEKPLFHTPVSHMGFWGCHRAHFLEEMGKLLPEGTILFGKRLKTYEDVKQGGKKVQLKFEDGETAEADAVIGCDGIKSRVRQLLLGPSNPGSYAHYSHKIAFRAVVPMPAAIAAIGQDKAYNQCMHMGPNAHVLNYPLAKYSLMNIIAFVTDERADWPHGREKMTAPGSKAEVLSAFKEWGPAVRAIIQLVPEELDQWAIFDMYDFPAEAYAKGRVCLAGDAAHAAAPHHGAGAGFGIEDALALACVLEDVAAGVANGDVDGAKAITAAFESFNAIRYERTQWLVRSSRETGDIYEWNGASCGSDAERCKEEMEQRTKKIWSYDVDGMMSEVKGDFMKRTAEIRK